MTFNFRHKQILNPEDCPLLKEIHTLSHQLPAVGGRGNSPQLGAKGPHTCSSPVGVNLRQIPAPAVFYHKSSVPSQELALYSHSLGVGNLLDYNRDSTPSP